MNNTASGWNTLSEQKRNEYAVAIFLPRDLSAIIAPLRQQFDPNYHLVDAHITIVFPFHTEMLLDDISDIVREEVARTEPMTLTLGNIGDFYPKEPVIYWSVTDDGHLNRLHKNLYAKLDLPIPHRDFKPHVTIAREISHHRVMLVKERIVPYLPESKFDVRSVELIAPVANARWVSVRTFRLPPAM